MEINLHEKSALIWLTKAERDCEKSQARVKELIKEYASRKLFVAVFISGNESLLERTSDLLCHNQETLARDEEYEGPVMSF